VGRGRVGRKKGDTREEGCGRRRAEWEGGGRNKRGERKITGMGKRREISCFTNPRS
jgi:hypothetical protein